jgi:hypothetical protein
LAYNDHTGQPNEDEEQRAALQMVLDRWPLPLTVDVNPMLDRAAARHRSWLVHHGLVDFADPIDPLTTLRADQVAAYAYPRANLSALALATDWTAWFFHFDDYFDEGPLGTRTDLAQWAVDFFHALLGNADGTPAPPDSQPLSRTWHAFAGLLARSREIMSSQQRSTFEFHLSSYLDALVVEAGNRENNRIPDIDSYCALRRDTGPALPLLDLIEHTEKVCLPEVFRASPLFGRILGTTADLGSWINDVFSVSKELDRGDCHNLVLVIRHATGMSLIDATSTAIDRIREHLRWLDDAEPALEEWCATANVPQPDRHQIHRWARGMRDFLHHGAWYIQHSRYSAMGVRS